MKTLLNRLYKAIMPLLVVLCVVLIVLKVFGVSVICIRGTSMEPNYKSGELHLIAKEDEYERGDVVAVRVDGMTILKRIIAIEGDTVEIYHHCVWVNGETVAQYIKGETWNESGAHDTCQTIGLDEIYLLGDNRNTSGDSRHFGTIKTEQILGKVVW